MIATNVFDIVHPGRVFSYSAGTNVTTTWGNNASGVTTWSEALPIAVNVPVSNLAFYPRPADALRADVMREWTRTAIRFWHLISRAPLAFVYQEPDVETRAARAVGIHAAWRVRR